MEVYTLWDDGSWKKRTFKDVFGVGWEDGEDQETFISNAGFYISPDTYGGFVKVYTANFDKGRKGFFITVNLESHGEDFYAEDFLELIKIFNLIGMNFFTEKSKQSLHQRIIYSFDLIDYFSSYESITPLMTDDHKFFITSYEPITTDYERREIWRKQRAHMEKREIAKKKDSAPSAPTT